MLFVSDVHDAPGPLRRLVALGDEIAILGDLVNLTDYRTGKGAVAEVFGAEFAARTSKARALGDYEGMRSLWREHAAGWEEGVREQIGAELGDQYRKAGEALSGGHGLVIHGNVDRPKALLSILPEGFEYAHGKVFEREGLSLGFVGGGIATPLGADGEVPDEEMDRILEALGPVDVLCTHVPPAIHPLRHDVVTGRQERGSGPIREYLERERPRYHFFGDIHQPQASTWRLGSTRCVNAGYFRATGRFLRLRDAVVSVGALG
ncbi:MAG TPA: metallophosphoesterase [Acidimicrobiia bacterium]|nr:metallophosphoesterase [Acidimicrobiia bacterium]